MEGVIAADGAAAHNGDGTVHWKVLWAEVRILWYVMQGRSAG